MISIYLAAGLSAWIVAQAAKYILATLKRKKLADSSRLYLSGGMPSAHSATTVAILTVIGVRDGIDSSIFAVMAILTAIVIYDAVMVRRSSGEQGEAVIGLIKEQKSDVRKPFVAKGHTLPEIAVGSILGYIIGLLFVFV